MSTPPAEPAPPPDLGNLPPIPSLVVTVSSRGIQNGRARRPNAGAQFGPDTPGSQTSGLQEAFDRAGGQGGPGVVTLVPDGVYEVRAPLVFRPRVRVDGQGAMLHNAGGLATPFLSRPDEVLWRARIVDLTLDAGNVPGAVAFLCQGAQRSTFDLTLVNATVGARVLPVVNATPVQPLLHGNACLNQFRFQMNAIAGDALVLDGSGDTACVTDNTFPEVYATNVGRAGLVCAKWVDSNLFGHLFVSLNGPSSVGAVFNTLPDPRQNAGVYDMHLAKLSVDAFGQQGVDAVRLNYTKQILISQLYTSPEGRDFGGTPVRDVAAESYCIYSAGENRLYSKGIAGLPLVR